MLPLLASSKKRASKALHAHIKDFCMHRKISSCIINNSLRSKRFYGAVKKGCSGEKIISLSTFEVRRLGLNQTVDSSRCVETYNIAVLALYI